MSGVEIVLSKDDKLRKYNRLYKRRYRQLHKSLDLSGIYVITGGRCVYCGVEHPLSKMARDHVVSHVNGGGEQDNLTMACSPCNGSKHNHTLEQWRYTLKKKQARLPYISSTIKRQVLELYRFDIEAAERGLVDAEIYQFWFERQGFDISELVI